MMEERERKDGIGKRSSDERRTWGVRRQGIRGREGFQLR